jgi:hypothetical protein
MARSTSQQKARRPFTGACAQRLGLHLDRRQRYIGVRGSASGARC